ncbi:MAG: serine kinase [Symploca sp. SIO2E6]|nr:serine kinase [Symploca sp. SIO2E6]
MFSYFAYGLGIHSELPIPEFIPAPVECDVTLYIEKDSTPSDYLLEDEIEEPWSFDLTREEAFFYVKDIGVFIVEEGKNIIVVPAPDVSEQLLRLHIVGNIMSLVLYLRGLLVLHASVVNINGGAVAFLGESGQGKSSTAAAFHKHGYRIITDDVAPVTLDQKPITITPGFPQIKLGRETAAILGCDFDSLHILHPSYPKRGYRLGQDFPQTPLPIRGIYVLTYDDEFGVEPLTPQEAVIELSRYAHPETLFYSRDPAHFLQCTALAKECTLYRLKRPRNLNLLPELVKQVEQHLSNNLQLVTA